MKKKKVVFIIALVIIALIILVGKRCITETIIETIYPERKISFEEIVEKEAIKEFEIVDEWLISTSFDPWIYIEYNKFEIENPRSIKIFIEDIDDTDPALSVFFVTSYEAQYHTKIKGENNIDLQYYSSDDIGIRLDLTSQSGQRLKISSIIFNDTVYLTSKYLNYINKVLAYLLILTFGMFIIFKLVPQCSRMKKTNCVFISLFILFFIIVSSFIGGNLLSYCFLSLLITILLGNSKDYISPAPKMYNKINFLGSIILALTILCAKDGKISPILNLSRDCIWRTTVLLILTAEIWLSGFKILNKKVGIVRDGSYLKEKSVINVLFGNCLIIIISYVLLEIILTTGVSGYSAAEYLFYLRSLFNSELLFYNVVVAIVLYYSMVLLIGKLYGGLIYGSLYLLFLSSNIIKIRYQGQLIKLADIYLIHELMGIAKQYISIKVIGWLVILTICVGSILFFYIKRTKSNLKPEFSIMAIPMVIILICLCMTIKSNYLSAISLDKSLIVAGDQQWLQRYGVVGYYCIMLSTGEETIRPDGYNEKIVEKIEAFKNDYQNLDGISPNVILILAESLFEVDRLPDLTFDRDLFKNTRKYISNSVISPSYGGRTAAAELEALTGLSNYFLQNNMIAYTTYFKSENKITGSLAREFRDAGYKTIAMHPNRADYYNRDVVYKCMGFDQFLSIEAFDTSASSILNDGFVKDEEFFNVLIEQLQATDLPVFIFGATIEGHSPYERKLETSSVTASSEKYNSRELSEVEKYAQTVLDLDTQLGKLFDYLDTCEKPTLVYVFGDHLPPLSIYSSMEYTNDIYNKFSTPLIRYSNYKEDINVENEILSLSQIAPQILSDAEICHRSYFDFLLALRSEYPIIHQEFPIKKGSMLDLYESVQYDILFGEQYLLK